MLYHLLENLENYDFPGSGLYKYLSFRAGMALLISLLISTIYGKRIISFLQRKQIGETVRDLGLSGQNEKAGTNRSSVPGNAAILTSSGKRMS